MERPATIGQAKSLGGVVVKELTGMPNGGSYAVLADPQGAQFGVYASSLRMRRSEV